MVPSRFTPPPTSLVSSSENTLLSADVARDEIQEAIWALARDKASSSDRFHPFSSDGTGPLFVIR